MVRLSTLMLLSSVRFLPVLLRRWLGRSTRQIHVYPSLVMFRAILQPELLADLLDSWLDLLYVVGRVIPLSHNNVQVRLPLLSSSSYPLFKDILSFLYELAV